MMEPYIPKAEAEVEIVFPQPEIENIVAEAIAPELKSLPTDRTSVNLVKADRGVLRLTIVADDISALRAALNSYLRWIAAITRALNSFQKLMD